MPLQNCDGIVYRVLILQFLNILQISHTVVLYGLLNWLMAPCRPNWAHETVINLIFTRKCVHVLKSLLHIIAYNSTLVIYIWHFPFASQNKWINKRKDARGWPLGGHSVAPFPSGADEAQQINTCTHTTLNIERHFSLSQRCSSDLAAL